MLIEWKEVFLYLFCLYGVICFLMNIFDGLRRLIKINSNRNNLFLKFVLVVKNQEDTIEGTIRDIMNDTGNLKELNKRVIVIDMSSTDDTFKILKKLKTEYEYIDIIEEKDKMCLFEDFG